MTMPRCKDSTQHMVDLEGDAVRYARCVQSYTWPCFDKMVSNSGSTSSRRGYKKRTQFPKSLLFFDMIKTSTETGDD